MLKASTDPIDVQDIQFKLHCKIKIFDNNQIEPFSKSCNLLAAASVYGLLFVGATDSFQVIPTAEFDELTVKDGDKTDYLRRSLSVNLPVRHLSVNCDNSLLAVVVESVNCPVVQFFDVKSFLSDNISIVNQLQLSSTPGITVLEVNWNPTIPELFTSCKSDGSLGLYEIKKDIMISGLGSETGTTCFCWSPKGKQVAVGSRDGKITQYKPDLKAVRVINPPPLQTAVSIVSLQWISNYQFVGIYVTGTSDVAVNLIVVDAPKSGEVSYITYDDICYSNSPVRPVQFYMIHEPDWNVLMVASSNSTEVGIMYNSGNSWTQLTLMDSARAELPLSHDHSDTLPIGFAFCTSSVTPLPWGEGTILPPPKLFLFSHYGILCCFDVVNLKENASVICKPPMKLEEAKIASLFKRKDRENSNKGTENLHPLKPPALPQIGAPILNVNKDKLQEMPVNTTFKGAVGALNFSNAQIPNLNQVELPKQSSGLFHNQLLNPEPPKQSPGVFQNQSTKGEVLQQSSAPFHNQLTKVDPRQQGPPLFQNQVSKSTTFFNIPKIVNEPVISLPQVPKPQPVFPVKNESGVDTLLSSDSGSRSESTLITNPDLNDSELNDLLSRIIKDECTALESELNALLHQAKSIEVSVGTEDEKSKVSNLTISLQDFLAEVVNNNTLQKSDVHLLKQNLVQTWAWLEEARSRHNTSNDGTIATLLRAMPLDSAAEKQLLHIKHLMYYLDSQLKQAHGALDEHWENFQDYCKKTYKMQLPTMEAIFQAMVRHNAILNKLSYNLKDISTRVKCRNQMKTKSAPLVALNNLKKMEDSMKTLSIKPQDVFKMHYERIENRSKLLSSNKTSRLRDYLKQTNVKHVTSFRASLELPTNLISKLKQTSQITPSASNITQDRSKVVESLGSSLSVPGLPAHKTEMKSQNFAGSGLAIRQESSSKVLAATNKNFPVSAFVPTTLSSGLPDLTAQAAFKGVSPLAVEKPLTTTKSSVITPLTTASIFGNAAKTMSINQLSKTVQPGSTEGNFSFTPQKNMSFQISNQTKPLKFDSSAPVSESSVIIVETGNLSNTSSSKPLSFKLSNEVTLTKTTAPGSKSLFGLPSNEIQVTKVTSAVTSPTVLPNFSGSVGITIGKTFSAPAKPAFEISSLKQNESLTVAKPSFSSSVIGTTTTVFSAPTAPTFTFSIPSTQTSFGSDSGNFSKVPNTSGSTVENVFDTIKTAPENRSAETENAQSGMPSSSHKSVASLVGTQSNIFANLPAATIASTAVTTSSFGTILTLSEPEVAEVTKNLDSVITRPISVGTTSKGVSGSISTSTDTITNSAPSVVAAKSVFGTVSSSIGTTSIQPSLFGTPLDSKPSSFSTIGSPTSADLSKTDSISMPSAVLQTTVSNIFGGINTATTADSGTKAAPTAQSFTFNSVLTGSQNTGSPQTTIFGSSPSSAPQASIFAAVTSSPALFSSVSTPTKGSIFNSQAPASVSSTESSIFGTSTFSSAVSSAQSSIFAAHTQSPSLPSATKTSIFGTSPLSPISATAQSSVFGIPQNTVGSTSVTQSSVFGSPAQSAVVSSTQKSVFGTSAQNSLDSSSTQNSVFGGMQSSFLKSSSTPQTSVFGNVATTTTRSIFGSASTTTSTSSSVFGNTTSTASLFGTSTGKSIFGGTSTSFANASAANSPFASSVFGAVKANTTDVTGSSTFPAQSTSFSTFGVPTTTTSNFQPSPFSNTLGSTASAPTTSSGIGASSSAFVNLTASQFGAQSSSQSLFGAPASSAAGSFSFASPTTNTSFGFGNLNVSSTTPSSNTFGTSVNPFGKSSIFGTPSTQSSSVFGSGSSTPSTQSSVFGTNPSTPSAQPSIFGGTVGTPSTQSSVFGTPSTFGAQSQNMFGSQSAFGAAPASAPAFGQQSVFGQSSFGSSQPGPFSGGSSTVSQSGFGAPAAFQKPVGFGSSPVFGSSAPAFGTPPSFGGSPTFGSSPAFGSPEKVFGSGSMPSSFQTPTQENSTFANLANQNTIGFGNLAQQAQNSSSPFSGNSSFTSWR